MGSIESGWGFGKIRSLSRASITRQEDKRCAMHLAAEEPAAC